MIVRSIIYCETCQNPFLIRVSLGTNERHSHKFECPNCNELLELVVHINFEKVSFDLECKSNCFKDNETVDENSLKTINLHPDFLLSDEKLHDKEYFPSVELTYQVMLKQKELAGGVDLSLPVGVWKEMKDTCNTNYENWKIIKTSWSLYIKGHHDLAHEKIKKYRFHNFGNTSNINEVIFHFINIFLSPYKNDLVHNLMETSKLVLRGKEYERFIKYYNEQLKKFHYQKYFEIFSEYFQNYEEFGQVLNHIKYDLERTGYHATSRDFSKIKMFYGNCYEILTSLFIILSCINNLISNRPFDEFKTMKLNKYLSIDKSGRANNFSENTAFSILSSHLNSKIRNASHHQNIVLDGKFIKYRTKGDSLWHKLSYEEYLVQCNLIFFDICRLFQYELIITNQ